MPAGPTADRCRRLLYRTQACCSGRAYSVPLSAAFASPYFIPPYLHTYRLGHLLVLSNVCVQVVSTHAFPHPPLFTFHSSNPGFTLMMNPSFTREEKLFVLAEMIKASRIDVDSLVRFIKYHKIEPDWMSMQIPLGRNMNQCMQFAEHISVATTSLKRRPSDDYDHPSKRPAFSDMPEQPRPTSSPGILQPAVPSQTVNYSMQARVPNGTLESPPPPPAPMPAKKRGRPSRADKAKRDLRPLLPQHLAPRPPPGTAPQVLSPNAPRPILPAITSPRALHGLPVEPRSWSPPSMYKGPVGTDDKPLDKRREHPDTDASLSHILVDDTSGDGSRRRSLPALPQRSPSASTAYLTAATEVSARLSPRETAAIYGDTGKGKSPMPAVSPLIRKLPLPLSNPA